MCGFLLKVGAGLVIGGLIGGVIFFAVKEEAKDDAFRQQRTQQWIVDCRAQGGHAVINYWGDGSQHFKECWL